MKRLLLALALLLAACAPSWAGTLVEGPLRAVVPDEVAEGQPFLVEVTLENQVEHVFVEWMGKTVEIPMARKAGLFRGEALLGAGLGAQPGEQTLVVEALRPNRRELVLGKVRVTPGTFPEQHLKLPPQMVTPSKENLARIKREQELVARTVGETTLRRFWSLPFIRPVPGEITSAFGLRRILNGQPRSPHSGVDLNGASGETVLAAAQGRVALTGDFYYNGKSIFLDHGNGVFTMYFHLSAIDVAEGQHVERGQQIGKVGATGRATGPHLHLGLKVLGQNLDPMPLFTSGGVFDRTSRGGLMSGKENAFEKNIERLQQIVEQLESGEPTLEKGVNLYKEGMTLASACRKQLDKARLTVTMVMPEGLAPFNAAETPDQGEEN